MRKRALEMSRMRVFLTLFLAVLAVSTASSGREAQQVAAIRDTSLSSRQAGGRGAPPAVISTAAIPKESPLASQLERVPDIQAETTVGQLPRLPQTIPAVYRDRSKGPEVRVIWPAPTDNSQTLKPGTYTVIGRVPGTPFQPKATVTVKETTATPTLPRRTIEPFPLGQVVLDRDTRQRETPFIRNRDKFIRGLAETNPDSFLYKFRDAFGQTQPEGAEPLGGWDNQTTRLRGHASGHYLSAIAQAYASLTYDEALRATFLQRMNYLIDTLYDLSQKSGRPAQEGGTFTADPTAVPPGPGRTDYDSNLRADGIRTDYWNWGEGSSAPIPRPVHHAGAGRHLRRPEQPDLGPVLHAAQNPRRPARLLRGRRQPEGAGDRQGHGALGAARLSVLPTATRISMWNRYIAGEYGGMNEVMARLYRAHRRPAVPGMRPAV